MISYIKFFNELLNFQNKAMRSLIIIGILVFLTIAGIRLGIEQNSRKEYHLGVILFDQGEFTWAKQKFQNSIANNYKVEECQGYLAQIAKQDSFLMALFTQAKEQLRKNYDFVSAFEHLAQLTDTCDSEGYYLRFKNFIRNQQIAYIQKLADQKNWGVAYQAVNSLTRINQKWLEGATAHRALLLSTLQRAQLKHIQEVANQQQFQYANQLDYNYLNQHKDTSGFEKVMNYIKEHQKELAIAAAAAAAAAVASNNFSYNNSQIQDYSEGRYRRNYSHYSTRSTYSSGSSSYSKGKRGRRGRRR